MKLQVNFFKRAFCICNGISLGTNITDFLSSLREAKKWTSDYDLIILNLLLESKLMVNLRKLFSRISPTSTMLLNWQGK